MCRFPASIGAESSLEDPDTYTLCPFHRVGFISSVCSSLPAASPQGGSVTMIVGFVLVLGSSQPPKWAPVILASCCSYLCAVPHTHTWCWVGLCVTIEHSRCDGTTCWIRLHETAASVMFSLFHITRSGEANCQSTGNLRPSV